MHGLLLEVRGKHFDVAAAAVDALLVLDGELDDEGLALVAEVVEAGRQRVEAGVLACLQTCFHQIVSNGLAHCMLVCQVIFGKQDKTTILDD